jgi:hypothetical protein
MPFGAHAASRGAGSGTESSRRVAPAARRGQRGKTGSLDYQEPVSGHAERSVMVEASPTTALLVSQSQLLFQFLVITPDDPSMMGQPDQRAQATLRRLSGQPVFRRFRFARRPFDPQPFFRVGLATQMVAVYGANANRRKARAPLLPGTLAPGNHFPHPVWQLRRQLLDRDRLVPGAPVQPSGRAASPLPPFFSWRDLARPPNARVLPHAHHLAQTQFRNPFSKSSLVAIAGIRRDRSCGHPLLDGLTHLPSTLLGWV